MKTFYFICAFAVSTLVNTSCSNDDTILNESNNMTTTRAANDNLVNYLTVEEGQWILTLSKQDAASNG